MMNEITDIAEVLESMTNDINTGKIFGEDNNKAIFTKEFYPELYYPFIEDAVLYREKCYNENKDFYKYLDNRLNRSPIISTKYLDQEQYKLILQKCGKEPWFDPTHTKQSFDKHDEWVNKYNEIANIDNIDEYKQIEKTHTEANHNSALLYNIATKHLTNKIIKGLVNDSDVIKLVIGMSKTNINLKIPDKESSLYDDIIGIDNTTKDKL